MVDQNQPEDVASPGLPEDRPKVVAYTKKEKAEEPVKDDFNSAQESYKAELSGKGSEKKNETGGQKTKIPKSSSGGSIGGAFKAMMGFFTIIRTDVTEKDIQSMEGNFWLAPLIGAFIGLISMIVCLVFYELGAPSAALAVLALATAFVISKFLHFDGLVDFGDGMIATGDREKRIRALKDTTIGAGGFGVAFIVILLSFVMLGSFGFIICAIVWPMEILVKNAMVSAAAFGDPGNGMASNQVRKTTMQTLMMSTIIACVAGIVALLIGMGLVQIIVDVDLLTSNMIGKYLVMFAVGAIFSILVGFGMAKIANKTFGFVNGDVLGATNEMSRAVMLLFMFVTLSLLFNGVI